MGCRLIATSHAGKDDLLTPKEAACGSSRGQESRVDDGARKKGRLLPRERRSRYAEVGSRGGLRAPDAVAPFDDVEIELEDARLGQGDFEPPRDDELLDLSERVVRRREIQVLRQLLRDRAGAAWRLAPFHAVLD